VRWKTQNATVEVVAKELEVKKGLKKKENYEKVVCHRLCSRFFQISVVSGLFVVKKVGEREQKPLKNKKKT